ncbi:diadenylate cyclase [Leptospira levettii]|uniref:diadenylate cyclase n=1 Tax=Leptospira levettii TaxID=2023178 RepID=UPI00223CD8F4|nr:diadenylate cyclase [Leptospira levettii]MCW7498538.1 diadenylate cyclase [Leptospira levettii]
MNKEKDSFLKNIKQLHQAGTSLIKNIDSKLDFKFYIVYSYLLEKEYDSSFFGNTDDKQFNNELQNFSDLIFEKNNYEEIKEAFNNFIDYKNSSEKYEFIGTDLFHSTENYNLLYFYKINRNQISYYKSLESNLSEDRNIILSIISKFYLELTDLRFEKMFTISKRIMQNEFTMELANETAKSFVINLISNLQGPYDGLNSKKFQLILNICDDLDAISELLYEKKRVSGKISISSDFYPKINSIVKLEKPIGLNNHKLIRKLLEGTSENIDLILDSGEITGYTYTNSNNVFKLNFIKQNIWKLQESNQTIAIFKSGKIDFNTENISEEYFINEFTSKINIFPSINQTLLKKIALELINSDKGSILIIHENAKEESLRLKNDGIKSEPFILTSELARNLSKIDGALIIDPNCKCYGFGLILDGISLDNGNLERGSRYNSSKRYINNRKKLNENLIAIITSDDGNFDILS